MVNYPNGRMGQPKKIRRQLANTPTKANSFSRRGMRFEEAINQANTFYLAHDRAVIHKKPTPIQIVKVDYPMRSRAKITEAYFRHASTTDYSGVYKGRYLDFEAKTTQLITAFPFKNFHAHQIQHMKQVIAHGGIAFVLLYFQKLDQTYLLEAQHVIKAYQDPSGKKSLSLAFIQEEGYLIPQQQVPLVDYLPIIDQLLGGEHHF